MPCRSIIVLVALLSFSETANGEDSFSVRFAFLGDSHIAGTDEYPGFARDLASMLPPGDVEILAIGGFATRQWVPSARIFWRLFDVESVRPEVGFILLGTGDASAAPRLEAEAYVDNLETMAAAWIQSGAGQIVLISPPQASSIVDADMRRRLEDYDDELRRFCKTSDPRIRCGPRLWRLINHPEKYLRDFVHLNEYGNARALAALLDFLEL